MRVHIVGLGLMGGSLAGALSRAGCSVGGSDPDADSRQEALRRGWIHEEPAAPSAETAEILVLAMHPGQVLAALPGMLARCGPDCVVTDLASAKVSILAAARGLRQAARFAGGHPLCGNAGSGIAVADPDLFRRRPWILVPGPETSEGTLQRLRQLLERVQARPVEMNAAAHDRLMARVSHLPQVLAKALALQGARAGVEAELRQGLFGGGFRDMTRLAASPAALWAEILAANRQEVLAALAEFKSALIEVEKDLKEEGSRAALLAWLEEGSLAKAAWPAGDD
jgi:prephenate dehydrogenase